ncbi:MAG TPA: ATP-binding protein [Candidatus Thiothrix moscowensis]|uniref:PAS domain-containing sensor histidine kinase n=1 Tax=unclassified Thiothrix TaxID=2636184 RepID=UPI0025DB5793|nr:MULTISPECIES: ATP-binding protein [unclassified Thiothrix]HRJ51751.1 ATP-binding protein [Candidatus Thiothrix moscowensis]HRJ92066.1 ATP-binding protein [Candidatus Thiothrix moscowensis]
MGSQEPTTDFSLTATQEQAWIEVIHKMDETYADLLHYQVELESKNAALEEAQQFITSIEAAMTDVLIVCDFQGRIQRVNTALERIVGKTSAELLNQPFQSLFTQECLPLVNSFQQKIRATAIHDCEITLQGVHEPVPLAMNCTSRTDARGRIEGMVLIGRPVGELRKAFGALHQAHEELQHAQQQLVSSEKMAALGRLVAGVAHELNNPISFVYANMHAMQRYASRIREYLDNLHSGKPAAELHALRQQLRIDHILKDMDSLVSGTVEGAERVSDIVRDLRSFSSSQTDKTVRFDLLHVLETSVRWVVKGSRMEVIIVYDLPDELWLEGIPGQIQQVIINLVQNALDAMRACAKPRLYIIGRLEGNEAVLSIHDEGTGIASENLVRVFDPFFTTKPIGQGTGLGLSISYGIIAEHGGKLLVRNHPNGGAEFTVRLPLNPSPPAPHPAASGVVPQGARGAREDHR